MHFLWLFFTSFAFATYTDLSQISPLPDSLLDQPAEKDCRKKIKKIVCLVNKKENDLPRSCLKGSKLYAPHFESLYDQYPPTLQKMFCSLDVIYIEKEFEGTAYAGTVANQTALGIRQRVLDEKASLAEWVTWKEQLSFGGGDDYRYPSPNLPFIHTKTTISVDDFLYFVIAHEFGHLFDFANDITETEGPCEYTEENPNPECKIKKGSFAAFSWETTKKVKAEKDFPHREDLCFYWCNNQTIDPSLISELYENLNRSDFISTYATTNPWDDFAESLAFFVIDQQLKSTYSVDTKHGQIFDLIEKLNATHFSHKYDYIKKFLFEREIVYP